jgi:hypothetical protein
MKKLDGREFNERRKKCSKATQELLAFLETVAENAAPTSHRRPSRSRAVRSATGTQAGGSAGLTQSRMWTVSGR